jgi:hypothetical protein
MKQIIIFIIALSLTACEAYGDKYDGLIVVDGNGNKYQLKHRIADVYFVHNITEAQEDNPYVNQANSKMVNK